MGVPEARDEELARAVHDHGVRRPGAGGALDAGDATIRDLDDHAARTVPAAVSTTESFQNAVRRSARAGCRRTAARTEGVFVGPLPAVIDCGVTVRVGHSDGSWVSLLLFMVMVKLAAFSPERRNSVAEYRPDHRRLKPVGSVSPIRLFGELRFDRPFPTVLGHDLDERIRAPR